MCRSVLFNLSADTDRLFMAATGLCLTEKPLKGTTRTGETRHRLARKRTGRDRVLLRPSTVAFELRESRCPMNDTDGWEPLSDRLTGLLDLKEAAWTCPGCGGKVYFGQRSSQCAIERHCECGEARLFDRELGIQPWIRFRARRVQRLKYPRIVLRSNDATYRELWRNYEESGTIRIYEITRKDGSTEFCGAIWFSLNGPPDLSYYPTFADSFMALFGRAF